MANRPRYAKNLITYPSRDAKGEQLSNLGQGCFILAKNRWGDGEMGRWGEKERE
ncbi:hypothetical protein [Moorena producens]|uniref:hypothetical protein n=1 Tax=Moorena producens TaxID=1155739 RepID=UPI003C75F1FB